ncbi:hypothetical protein L596_023332 [Steinernema carpocapsae]|uniref:F-box domain-containing protein n=1 Tax=Steinernema carpocapsae TaxID=34508 RepID=A0A4U5MDD4_STECR|nr:hypothetical protein L596_023332 [Steinernema carpocapsae]
MAFLVSYCVVFIVATFYFFCIRRKKPKSTCTIDQLPPEVLLLIFKHLKNLKAKKDGTFYKCRTVCRHWKPLIEELSDPVTATIYWFAVYKKCLIYVKHQSINGKNDFQYSKNRIDPDVTKSLPKCDELFIVLELNVDTRDEKKSLEEIDLISTLIHNVSLVKNPKIYFYCRFDGSFSALKKIQSFPIIEKANEAVLCFAQDPPSRHSKTFSPDRKFTRLVLKGSELNWIN